MSKAFVPSARVTGGYDPLSPLFDLLFPDMPNVHDIGKKCFLCLKPIYLTDLIHREDDGDIAHQTCWEAEMREAEEFAREADEDKQAFFNASRGVGKNEA